MQPGQPHFPRFNQTQFPSVHNTWHGAYVDYLELSIGEKLRTGIYEAKFLFFDQIAAVEFARCPGRSNTSRMKPQHINGYRGPIPWAFD